LAQKFDGEQDGFFRALISESRIDGPIAITYTKNDRAVGVAYPLASRIAFQKAAALGERNDPYGGMGRNGAQHTPEAEERSCRRSVGNTSSGAGQSTTSWPTDSYRDTPT
jgi:hypothetical protein